MIRFDGFVALLKRPFDLKSTISTSQVPSGNIAVFK